MAKFVSPLLGYNNNVRHKNRVFHIQTEDSGVARPHIITHLFMDGGRILKSVKTSYAEHVGTDGMTDTVRQMMKEQHKAMFIALRDGQYDHIVEGKPKPEGPPLASPAVSMPAPSPQSLPTPLSIPIPTSIPLPPSTTSPATVPELQATRAVDTAPPPPPMLTLPPPVEANAAALAPDLASDEQAPATARAAEAVPARELTLDFDALERDAHDTRLPAPIDALPPPPANLFAKEAGTGGYRALAEREAVAPAAPARAASLRPEEPSVRSPPPPPPPPPPARGAAPSMRPPPPASLRPPTEGGRYASARPAAIFGPQTQRPQPPSIFSDELVSDKSLDEVILSYLAEDLDPPRKK